MPEIAYKGTRVTINGKEGVIADIRNIHSVDHCLIQFSDGNSDWYYWSNIAALLERNRSK